MITLVLIQMIHIVLVQLLGSVLPAVDSTLLVKFTDTFDWVSNTITGVGYYYLPITAIAFAVNAVISVWLLSFGIKLFLKLTHIFTGGIVKTDKI
jgi:hypothetical protein